MARTALVYSVLISACLGAFGALVRIAGNQSHPLAVGLASFFVTLAVALFVVACFHSSGNLARRWR
jgi:H+/gluconate symporter-like permease